MTGGRPVAGWAATRAMARLTLMRLTRGRTFWVSVVLLVMPLILAAAVASREKTPVEAYYVSFRLTLMLLAIIPPLHLAAVLGEEVEDKTFTYLWSRPLPRWSVVTGKVLALVPVLIAAFAVSVAASYATSMKSEASANVDLMARAIGGMSVGVLGASMTSVGFGSLMPRFPVPITIAYIFVFDVPVGALPIKLKYLSFSYHARVVGGETIDNPAMSVVWALALAALWLSIALWRVSRAELRGE